MRYHYEQNLQLAEKNLNEILKRQNFKIESLGIEPLFPVHPMKHMEKVSSSSM